jgi:hypothetical protein
MFLSYKKKVERIMQQDEVAYLMDRANAEFQAAQRAKSVIASRPHYSMAVQYLEKAEALERRLRG